MGGRRRNVSLWEKVSSKTKLKKRPPGWGLLHEESEVTGDLPDLLRI